MLREVEGSRLERNAIWAASHCSVWGSTDASPNVSKAVRTSRGIMAVAKNAWAATHHGLIGVASGVQIHERPLCGNFCDRTALPGVHSNPRAHVVRIAWEATHHSLRGVTPAVCTGGPVVVFSATDCHCQQFARIDVSIACRVRGRHRTIW